MAFYSKFAEYYPLPPNHLDVYLKKLSGKIKNSGIWVFQVLNWDYLLQFDSYTFPVLRGMDGRISFYREYPEIN